MGASGGAGTPGYAYTTGGIQGRYGRVENATENAYLDAYTTVGIKWASGGSGEYVRQRRPDAFAAAAAGLHAGVY